MDLFQALPTGHGLGIIGGDPFDFSTMSRLLVARIARDHAIFVEKVKISLAGILVLRMRHAAPMG